uniref:Peptidase C51 domain-containing protein n=1 Tax=Geobacter sp. (strain M21) TaxID=443144 RepID=C6E910_GEOSM
MRHVAIVVLTLAIAGRYTPCYAVRCNCDVWMEKGGYCVDYIKDRIPSFLIPSKDDMVALKNTDIAEITEGDVAIFAVKNYWHVAYVESVHRNLRGEATAIDVSEMNFGDELSYLEFKTRWKSNSRHEWNQALCCGITENYDRITWRKNISISKVKQVWSPDNAPSEGIGRQRVKAFLGKARDVFNELLYYTDR